MFKRKKPDNVKVRLVGTLSVAKLSKVIELCAHKNISIKEALRLDREFSPACYEWSCVDRFLEE